MLVKKIKNYGLIIFATLFCFLSPIEKVSAITNKTSYPFQGSAEKIYQDTIMGLIWPKINKAVDNYYKKYFKDNPLLAPYELKFLSVDARINEPNTGYPSFFEVKVQVMPYFGPHLNVGVDNITFKIGVLGDVQVKKFEHIKSYELPWNYQKIIISKWPPR